MASETVRFGLDKAAGILEREVGRVFGIHEKIEKVKRELRLLQGFLKDAEGKSSYGKEGVKQRVKEMNEIACECEDVIDRYFVEVEYYNMRTDWRGKGKKQIRKPLQLPGRRSIAIDIEELLKKLDDLTSRKDTYDIQSLQDGRDEESVNLQLERRINSSPDEGNSSVTVGLQSETSELAAMLRGGTQSRLCVVSIVGQGGLGKTTLARKVYREVKGSFAVSAWVYVSRNCNTKEVLRELCKACAEYHDQTSGSSKDQIANCANERELREKANVFLKEKSYLIVLDDVWTRKAWDRLKGALPNDHRMGSRVLMTTRNMDVAQYPDSCTRFCPPLLNPQDGYELFCNTVFRRHPNRSPSNRELKELAEKIVSKCGGLPLAIVVAEGLLSGKPTTARAWGEVLSGLRSDLTEENCEVSKILSLSFDDLPYSLKPCLLYCCAFPVGDYDIPVRRLVRLWIAEGFVKWREGRTPEGVAIDYLYELIDRSLIQPSKLNSMGEIKSCRVHDVTRELLIQKASDRNFFTVLHDPQPADTHHHSGQHHVEKRDCRRFAIHLHPKPRPSLPRARCFMSFANDAPPKATWYDKLIETFELLKVLDLEGVTCVSSLPSAIGALFLLTYLGLRNTSIETLPRSTKKLLMLQTFDVSGATGFRFASGFEIQYFKAKHLRRFKELRHLCLPSKGRNDMTDLPENFGENGSAQNLRTLTYVKAGPWIHKSTCGMTNLRKILLQLTNQSECTTAFMDSIGKLEKLESLHLRGPLPNLSLAGESLGNIIKLTLIESSLRYDSFQRLQLCVPNLKILRLLRNSYIDITMTCGSLPHLEILCLEGLERLEIIMDAGGKFERLRLVRIASCASMVKLPDMIDIGTIQVLKLVDMPQLLERGGRSLRYEHQRKIRHATSVILTTSEAEKQFDDWKMA